MSSPCETGAVSQPHHPEDSPGDEQIDREFREIVAGLRPPSHLGERTPEGMATDHRSYEPPEEDDHFVPPDPPPLPAGDLHFWAIMVGLVVGPFLVLISAVIPILSRGWTTVGVLLALAGFVLLVLRQPRNRRPDDGDLGAQV